MKAPSLRTLKADLGNASGARRMMSGAQLSLYPMSDDFVDIILDAVKALDRYRNELRIETDDISTLIIGAPETLFPAMRDLFVRAAASGKHFVLSDRKSTR